VALVEESYQEATPKAYREVNLALACQEEDQEEV
jgi:hypothetical protein